MALDERDLEAISELLDCKFEKELGPIREDISDLKEDVSSLQSQMNHLTKKVDRMDERLERVETRVDAMDERLERMETRVDAMDERLERMETRVDVMDERLIRVEHNQEQEMFRMNMLYETFIPTHRVTKLEENVEAIKEDMSIMKVAIVEVANSVSREQGSGFRTAAL